MCVLFVFPVSWRKHLVLTLGCDFPSKAKKGFARLFVGVGSSLYPSASWFQFACWLLSSHHAAVVVFIYLAELSLGSWFMSFINLKRFSFEDYDRIMQIRQFLGCRCALLGIWKLPGGSLRLTSSLLCTDDYYRQRQSSVMGCIYTLVGLVQTSSIWTIEPPHTGSESEKCACFTLWCRRYRVF